MSSYCTAGLTYERTCHLAAWDLDGSNVKIYETPEGQYWQRARFSPDGKEFVFEIHDDDRYVTKLGIMNRGTQEWRIVEDADSYKLWPSYHPDGSKIAYALYRRMPDNYQTRTHVKINSADIFALDLATGETRALTDFNFMLAGEPYFTGRGDEVVYLAEYPYKILHDPKNAHIRDSYDELYQLNFIHRVSETEKNWHPDFVIDKTSSTIYRAHSSNAVPSQNGTIIYFDSNLGNIGKLVNPPESAAIWARQDGQNRRLMYYRSVTGWNHGSGEFTLSTDEKFFLIWASGWLKDRAEPGTGSVQGLWRIGVDGSEPRRIHIPWARLAVAAKWQQ